jgi:hypothetical protein
MKVKIQTEEGFYETEIKEQLSLTELLETIDRLKEVYRFLSPLTKKKDDWDDSNINYAVRETAERKTQKRDWCDTREKAVNIVKLHYTGTKEQKQEFANSIDHDWNDIVKSIWGLTRRYEIIPQDIGMNRFPGRGEQWQSNPALAEKFVKDNSNPNFKKTYSLSQLGALSWKQLQDLSIQFNISEQQINEFKSLDDTESLIVLLRQKMRQYENQN